MTAIGFVTRTDNGGFRGELKTLSIRADIDIVPNRDKSADTQPDFRVITQGIEIGAGWIRRGESSGKDYVSLSLAAPELGARKLYANLGRARYFGEMFSSSLLKNLKMASFRILAGGCWGGAVELDAIF